VLKLDGLLARATGLDELSCTVYVMCQGMLAWTWAQEPLRGAMVNVRVMMTMQLMAKVVNGSE
jgi:hypothetical protein